MLIYLIKTFSAVMSGSPAVSGHFNDAVLCPPLVAAVRMYPSVANLRRIRTAIDVHMNRILLGRVEILRIYDVCRKLQTVIFDIDELWKSIICSIVIISLHISDKVCGIRRTRIVAFCLLV